MRTGAGTRRGSRPALRPGSPDPTPRCPSGRFRFAQGGGLGAGPAVPHQRFAQVCIASLAVTNRPPLAVMAVDRTVDGAAAHQRGQRVGRRYAAIDGFMTAIMTNRTTRRGGDPRQPYHLIPEPQRIPVQHRTNSEATTTRVIAPPAAASSTPNKGGRRSRNGRGRALGRKIRRLWFKDTAHIPVVLIPARIG
jgi:hypothetical protein